jgi:hypothetical protein
LWKVDLPRNEVSSFIWHARCSHCVDEKVQRILSNSPLVKHIYELLVQKCRMRTRDVMHWSGINNDISRMISKCSVCSDYRNRQQKEPMISHEVWIPFLKFCFLKQHPHCQYITLHEPITLWIPGWTCKMFEVIIISW